MFEYKLLFEDSYRGGKGNLGEPLLDAAKLEADMVYYGKEGYRFIETIYCENKTWIIVLSRQYGNFNQNFASNRSGRYSNRGVRTSESRP